MLQQDTVTLSTMGGGSVAASQDSVTIRPARPQTPYQALRLLPKDATPAQQDSAIQAWFQPSEIHYSDRPDTLHLPGHDAGRSIFDPTVRQYYKDNFFSTHSPYYTETSADSRGMAGTPIPYTLRNDNTLTIILLLSLVVTVVSFARYGRFLTRQIRNTFFPVSYHSANAKVVETLGEMHLLLFLAALSCLQFTVVTFLYVTNYVADTFIFDSLYLLLALFFGMYTGYFSLKILLYAFVNNIFFRESKKTLQWTQSLLFIISLQGVLLFPIVLVQVYFGLSLQNVLYYGVFVLVLGKILTFYKSWNIFFRQNSLSLQIILYFCALEVVPLLAFAGVVSYFVNALKINF